MTPTQQHILNLSKDLMAKDRYNKDNYGHLKNRNYDNNITIFNNARLIDIDSGDTDGLGNDV